METSLFQAIGMIDMFFQERGIKGNTDDIDYGGDNIHVTYENFCNKFTFVYGMYDGTITAYDADDVYDGFWEENARDVTELLTLLEKRFVKDAGWKEYRHKEVILARPITEEDIKAYEESDPFSKPFELHRPFQLEVGDMLIKGLNYTMTPSEFKAKYH